MKKLNPYKFLIIVLGSLGAFQSYSQNGFIYKAPLGEINETKFYKINLPPQVVANCKPGLEDIRIFDEDRKQVPYILKNDLPVFKSEKFTIFPIIKSLKEKDKQTHITLQNITHSAINNLLLFVKNTDANRSFSVSGCDDGTHWFVIKENIYLDNFFNNEGETIVQTLSFPVSNYKYFQLTILGENVLPFNIVKAGIYNQDLVDGKYVKIPGPGIFQRDSSNKASYIHVHFDNKYLINKIIFDVDGGKYFNRKFSFFERNNNEDFVLEGNLISGSTNAFQINSKYDQFLLKINNEDNMPLKVNAVQAFQLNTYLLTYLQAGKNYFLYFADSSIAAPKYDLEFFSDSINKNPSEISVSNLEKNKIIKTETKAYSKHNTLLLWIIIVAVLIILCYLTFKMIGEVNRK